MKYILKLNIKIRTDKYSGKLELLIYNNEYLLKFQRLMTYFVVMHDE